MSRRRRSHYRLSLGWTSGVAIGGSLTRLNRPVQEFTCVRCCGSPRASSPHGLAAPASRVSRRTMLRAVASGSRLLPTRPVKDFHLQSSAHAGHTSQSAKTPTTSLMPVRSNPNFFTSGSVMKRGRCTLYRRAWLRLAEVEEAIEIAEKIDISSSDAVSPVTDMVCTANCVADRGLLDVCNCIAAGHPTSMQARPSTSAPPPVPFSRGSWNA
jgi:hypothetical protein